MDLENFNAGNAKCYICGYNSGPENSIFYGSPFHEICLNSLGSDWKDKITEPANPVLLYDWVTEKFASMPLPDLSDDGVVVIDDSESQVSQVPLYFEPGGNRIVMPDEYLPGKCLYCGNLATSGNDLYYGAPWHVSCLDKLGTGWREHIGNPDEFWKYILQEALAREPNTKENEIPNTEQ